MITGGEKTQLWSVEVELNAMTRKRLQKAHLFQGNF